MVKFRFHNWLSAVNVYFAAVSNISLKLKTVSGPQHRSRLQTPTNNSVFVFGVMLSSVVAMTSWSAFNMKLHRNTEYFCTR